MSCSKLVKNTRIYSDEYWDRQDLLQQVNDIMAKDCYLKQLKARQSNEDYQCQCEDINEWTTEQLKDFIQKFESFKDDQEEGEGLLTFTTT